MLWFKAFHIIFMVTWFAGLFYLPRIFVYHADAKDEISKRRFKLMAWRLHFIIMLPAAVLTWFFGEMLLSYNYSWYLAQKWMLVKLFFVVLLFCFHAYCYYCLRQFANDKNLKSSRFYRVMNEIPGVLLIFIVILAVVKPF